MGDFSVTKLYDGITIDGEKMSTTISTTNLGATPCYINYNDYEETKKEEENRKEDENMEDILKIYKERKVEQINDKFDKKKKEILSKDKFTKLYEEYERKVINLYKKEFETEETPYISYPILYKEKVTEIELKKLSIEMEAELNELNNMLEEVRAQAKLIKENDEDYYIYIRDLLQDYGILDSTYKINA